MQMNGGFEVRLGGGFDMRASGGFSMRTLGGFHANTHSALIPVHRYPTKCTVIKSHAQAEFRLSPAIGRWQFSV